MSVLQYGATGISVLQLRPAPAGACRFARGAPTSTDPRAWFARRTHDWHDFDASAIAAALRASGTTVSVIVPALNEEDTVADVVAVARGLQAGETIDEVVVVDGGSDDATVARARDAGARVVDQASILPDAGPATGKGDALWRGLAATSGDLVAFVDADLHDPDPRYVLGLLGPLMEDPSVRLVKACYDRPLTLDENVRPAGGGRVTELLARPLLATFWPDLAGVAQPLSGEYAGRRDALEAVPFVTGYGVEFGLLVDIADMFGPDAIAQCDLGTRSHAHQPLRALGRMAAEILGTAAVRLRREGRLKDGETLPSALLQPARDTHGRLRLEDHDLRVDERPPLRDWQA